MMYSGLGSITKFHFNYNYNYCHNNYPKSITITITKPSITIIIAKRCTILQCQGYMCIMLSSVGDIMTTLDSISCNFPAHFLKKS